MFSIRIGDAEAAGNLRQSSPKERFQNKRGDTGVTE